MARNRALHRIALRGVSRINLSRRLICWMDDIRMPRTALRLADGDFAKCQNAREVTDRRLLLCESSRDS
jgi:hypothetical protein